MRNHCNDETLTQLNFERLAKYLYETQWKGSALHRDNWEKEPDEWKWKIRNEARKILEFLDIDIDIIPDAR